MGRPTRYLPRAVALVGLMLILLGGYPVALAAPVAAPATSCARLVLHGTVGMQAVWMRLCVQGSAIQGTYFYERRGEDITLKGSVSQNGQVRVDETDPDGKQTGTFRGRMEYGLLLFDRWSDDRGNSFEVRLRPVPTVTEPRSTPVIQRLSLCKRLFKRVDHQYPVWVDYEMPRLSIEGNPYAEAKFNSIVRGWASDHIPSCMPGPGGSVVGFTKPKGERDILSIGYAVWMASPDLVTVLIEDFWYNAPTPHGYPSVSITLNYDIANARFFYLEDLFIPGSDYLERISRYCIETLRREWASDLAGEDRLARYWREWLDRGAGPRAGNFEIFSLDPSGLAITFDVYQVSFYARGSPTVIIPYSILQPVLRRGGIVDIVRSAKR